MLTVSRCSQARTLADEWLEENDPEGVVFEYEVIGVMDDEDGQGR